MCKSIGVNTQTLIDIIERAENTFTKPDLHEQYCRIYNEYAKINNQSVFLRRLRQQPKDLFETNFYKEMQAVRDEYIVLAPDLYCLDALRTDPGTVENGVGVYNIDGSLVQTLEELTQIQ